MSYSEDISQSFDTLLILIQDEAAQKPVTPEGKIHREKKLDFLVDDFITKAGHLKSSVSSNGHHTVIEQSSAIPANVVLPVTSLSLTGVTFLTEYKEETATAFTAMQAQKASLGIEIGYRMRNKKIKYITVVILWLFFSLFAFYKLGWNSFEQWTWIFPFVISIIIPYIYIIAFEKELSLIKFIKDKRIAVTTQVYKMYNFDEERLEKLEETIQKLNKLS